MARTRTSDQTLRHRHAKPLVYACWLALAAARSAAAQPAATAASVPCVGCQVLSVAPEQIAALPPRLTGVRMALRVAPRATAVEGVANDLRRRGASVTLHLTGVPAQDDALLAVQA